MDLARFLAAACASLSAAAAVAEDAQRFAVERIAPGVYLHRGEQAEASAANRGDIANIGFIVGERCVAVIDSGGSHAVGAALKRAVQETTGKPVCFVVNTHVHPDHVFGNAAFRDDGVVFVGHQRLPAALAARGQNYLRALAREVGAAAEDSAIVPPERLVSSKLELDLGGRIVELAAWPTAHTDNDLTVYDRASGTIWLGDLLFVERLPVVDGSLRGWLAAMREIRTMRVARMVPGHGPVQADWRALDGQAEYLDALARDVRAAIASNWTIAQAMDRIGSPTRRRWLLFDTTHRRNVAAAYAELEWAE